MALLFISSFDTTAPGFSDVHTGDQRSANCEGYAANQQ
jgi:hypothetical protein